MMAGAAAWQQAQQALQRRDFGAASTHLRATLAQAPTHAMARILLAGVELAEGRLRAACAELLLAAQTMPDDAATVCRLAQALMRVGETCAVRDCLGSSAVAQCRDGATLAALAHLQQLLGEHAQALLLMDRARESGYDNADFRYFRAIQLQFNGRIDEAERELLACLQMGPSYGRASLTLGRLRKQTPASQHLEAIRAQRGRAARGSEDEAACEFALYKELEDLGDYPQAWAALRRGNEVMQARLRPDAASEQQLYAQLMQACDVAWYDAAVTANTATPVGPRPIFIIGLPRSGTTVVDRILGNHSQVISAGELADFAQQLRYSADLPGRQLLEPALIERLPQIDWAEVGRRYLRQAGWRAQGHAVFVDKLPANFLLAGMIAAALPHATILHLVRDPMDVCFSNYRALFGDAYSYSYGLESLAAHYTAYRQLMAHWHAVMPGRILDVDYAELTTHPEQVTEAILAFCQLPREADCHDIARNSAPVATLSTTQVRERIHARGAGEWRRYEQELLPLREQLKVWL